MYHPEPVETQNTAAWPVLVDTSQYPWDYSFSPSRIVPALCNEQPPLTLKKGSRWLTV